MANQRNELLEQEELKTFLESAKVGDSIKISPTYGGQPQLGFDMALTISLYCPRCNFTQNHSRPSIKGVTNDPFLVSASGPALFSFACQNCYQPKIFTLSISRAESGPFQIQKIGEWPRAFPPLPKRLLKVVGDDREYLERGYQLELQGFGVGASAYYRRIVENRKNELLTEMHQAAIASSAPEEVIDHLQKAIGQWSFDTSVQMVKEYIPKRLLIQGHHNPLTLLHNALSEQLHSLTDFECLENAEAIREVLTELSDLIDSVLRDRESLHKAVSSLLKKPAPK